MQKFYNIFLKCKKSFKKLKWKHIVSGFKNHYLIIGIDSFRTVLANLKKLKVINNTDYISLQRYPRRYHSLGRQLKIFLRQRKSNF